MEMLNRLRELTKSYGNQIIDPQKNDQLKRTKAEIEKNVTRILKLIKNENQGKKEGKRKASKKETELLELVENFYKECHSVYALYDNLVKESGKTSRKHKECSSSSSSSDSEYYSSEEIDVGNDGRFEYEANSSSEVAELKHKLSSIIQQNDTLKMEYNAALEKIRQAEITNEDLKIEVDKKERELLAQVVKAHETKSLSRIQELEAQLACMKIEIESFRAKKIDHEAKQHLGEKRKGWRSRVFELESVLKDREAENSALMERLKENDKNFEAKMAQLMMQKGELEERLACEREHGIELMDQINVMKQEFESLKQKKSDLEEKMVMKSAENLDKMVQIESLNEELARKNLVMKKMIEDENCEKEINLERSKSLTLYENQNKGSYKQSKGMFKETKPNPVMIERKLEDLAEKFRVSFENKLRLLNQRILVTEQLHAENKESYKETRELYEKENKVLEEKVSSHEFQLMKMKETSETAEYALNNLDSVVCKFEKENDNFLNHISEVSNEIQFAKKWVVGTSGEIKRLKHKVDFLVAQLDDKEEQGFLLRDKVWKLEAKVSKEGGEKLNLIQEISHLEKKVGKYEKQIKENEERLLSLGDEKREVIRQLCMLVDYHRTRFDHLKQVVSKMIRR